LLAANVPAEYPRFVAQCAQRLLDESDLPGFQHIISYWPQVRPRPPNSEYDETAEAIIGCAHSVKRAVFVVLNYASSSLRHKLGPAIYLSKYAQDYIGVESLVAAEAVLFVSKEQCKQQGLQGGNGRPLQTGARVEDEYEDGRNKRICVNKTMTHGYEENVEFKAHGSTIECKHNCR
jgi:hypothetical protein